MLFRSSWLGKLKTMQGYSSCSPCKVKLKDHSPSTFGKANSLPCNLMLNMQTHLPMQSHQPKTHANITLGSNTFSPWCLRLDMVQCEDKLTIRPTMYSNKGTLNMQGYERERNMQRQTIYHAKTKSLPRCHAKLKEKKMQNSMATHAKTKSLPRCHANLTGKHLLTKQTHSTHSQLTY